MQSTEALAGGHKVVLGKTSGMVSRSEDVAGSWRSGALYCVIWYYPSGKANSARARKDAVTVATAAANWTERIAAGAVNEKDASAHASIVKAFLMPGNAVGPVAAAPQQPQRQALLAQLGDSFDGVAVRGDELTLTVKRDWHFLPRSFRQETADRVWKSWAGINLPRDPDKSYLKIVDANGRTIGGSGIMGSNVSVDDN